MSKKIRGDSDLFISNPNYSAFLNSRGLYDPFSFILKLNFSVSVTMNNLREKQFDSKEELSQDELYDFSTYLHETIHWWQHIGSVTGIILSLSPIIQTHSNFSPVKTFLKSFKVKSVYNFLASFESDKMISEEEDIANLIINNFLDIEFFKLIVIKPYEINRIQSSPLFQSVGHSYGIMYEFFNTILDKTFPSSEDIFPDYQSWDSKFKEMEISKTPGYFHGSGHSYAPIGLFEIFEGQARFNQLFFLHFSTNGLLDWLDFENRGLLEDQYKKAFYLFLEIICSEKPKSINDPLVALFLLLCDYSINSAVGFPFDINNFETFIDDVDPGLRFVRCCYYIQNNLSFLKDFIKKFSKQEYDDVCEFLSEADQTISPTDATRFINLWINNSDTFTKLLNQEADFCFEEKNLSINLLFSKFLRFQQTKLKSPEYFCWAGVYHSGKAFSPDTQSDFLNHQCLFTNDENGDLKARDFPEKNKRCLIKTFNSFYGNVLFYDTFRQLIIGDGEFNFNFFNLSSEIKISDYKNWIKSAFLKSFEVDMDDLKILHTKT